MQEKNYNSREQELQVFHTPAQALGNPNDLEEELIKKSSVCPDVLQVGARKQVWFVIKKSNVKFASQEQLEYWEITGSYQGNDVQRPMTAFKIRFKKARETPFTITWQTETGILTANIKVNPKELKSSASAPIFEDLIPPHNANYIPFLENNSNVMTPIQAEVSDESLSAKLSILIEIVQSLNGEEKLITRLTPDIRPLVILLTLKVKSLNQKDTNVLEQVVQALLELEMKVQFPDDTMATEWIERLGPNTVTTILTRIAAIPYEKFALCYEKITSAVLNNNTVVVPMAVVHASPEIAVNSPLNFDFEESKKRKRNDGSVVQTVSSSMHSFFKDVGVLHNDGIEDVVHLQHLYAYVGRKSYYWYNVCHMLQLRHTNQEYAPLKNVDKLVERFGGIERFMHVVKDLFNEKTCKFYHGSISSTNAETLLIGQPHGTYLLRDPSLDDYLLAISYVDGDGKVSHGRILIADTGYKAQKTDRSYKYFDKLEDLIFDLANINHSGGLPTTVSWMPIPANLAVEELSPDKYKGVNFLTKSIEGLNLGNLANKQ